MTTAITNGTFGVIMLTVAGFLGYVTYATAAGHIDGYGPVWGVLFAIGCLGSVCVAARSLVGRRR